MTGSPGGIARLVAAAEPTAPRALHGLLARLATVGLLKGAVVAGHATEASALGGIEIRSIAYDSRRAGPGALFVAIPGARADGHAFLPADLPERGPGSFIRQEGAGALQQVGTVPVLTDLTGAC